MWGPHVSRPRPYKYEYSYILQVAPLNPNRCPSTTRQSKQLCKAVHGLRGETVGSYDAEEPAEVAAHPEEQGWRVQKETPSKTRTITRATHFHPPTEQETKLTWLHIILVQLQLPKSNISDSSLGYKICILQVDISTVKPKRYYL